MIEIGKYQYYTTTEAARALDLSYDQLHERLEFFGVKRFVSDKRPSARLIHERDLERMRQHPSDADKVVEYAETGVAPSSNVRAFPNMQTADVNSLVAALHVEVDRVRWSEDRVRSFMAIITAMRSHDVLELYRTQTG